MCHNFGADRWQRLEKSIQTQNCMRKKVGGEVEGGGVRKGERGGREGGREGASSSAVGEEEGSSQNTSATFL